MNYFTHAYRYLDEPLFAIGSGIPDWLPVVDRRCRMRQKRVEPFAASDSPVTSALARGILRHLEDDRRFHQSRAFVELSMELTGLFRDAQPNDPGFRPAFLGHIIVELLLDDWLIARHPERLERYYAILDSADHERIEQESNRMATRPTDQHNRFGQLGRLIRHFSEARVLSDYADDARLHWRLNMVMRRVGFNQLPDGFLDLFSVARGRVSDRAAELLAVVEGGR